MKITNLFNFAKKKAEPPRLTMNICMLGARGVGKTSVITSMYNSQKEAVSGTNLFLLADGDTRALLDDKKNQLKNIFSGIHEEGTRMKESGIAGDSTESRFHFSYGMNSEKINIDLEIRDYPGEYLKTEPETVAAYVGKANAVLIAIDTPCMMEEGGKYNESKNRPELVKSFLMNYLKNTEEKLILFVPLKCEKYYRENRIDEVTEKVKEVYGDLLVYLRDRDNTNGFWKKICCAVTPIQTLGSVVFDSFEREEDGSIREIIARDGSVFPAGAYYKYLYTNADYEPEYCVQPLYYLLAFVSKQYQRLRDQEKQSGWFGKLREALRLLPNMDTFMLEIASLGLQRMDGQAGYKILFGRGRI